MIYDVRQETTYHYASTVAYARHVLRLGLIDRPDQRVQAAVLDVAPSPVERREGLDFFGNRTTWIALDQPHDRLTVRVAARVVVDRDGRGRSGRDAALGGRARGRLRQRRPVAAVAGAFPVPEPAGLARSGNSRLRRRELCARPGRCSTARST